MDDLSMDALLSALQTTQAVKSKVRLSDRNVVELVNKLMALGILGDDLLHTINGREYITVARLKTDLKAALIAAGGRLALAELPAMIGVDVFHCEKQAAVLVAESGGDVLDLQGELITSLYFDNIAAEINDLLQEAGKLRVGDLAVQYSLSTELLLTSITARLNTAIQGRLEGGLLFTPAHLRNIKAQLRGALRGVSSPATLPALAKQLALDVGGGGLGGGGILASLTEDLQQAGSVKGVLKGGGVNWVPAVYSATQQDAVRTFYTQNGWVAYDMVRRMGISNERTYLKSTFPDGVPLDTTFCSSALTSQVECAAEDAASSGGWVDVAPLLPSALTSADVTQLMDTSTGVQAMLRTEPIASSAGTTAASTADLKAEGVRILAGSCIVSNKLLQALQARVDDEARAAAEVALRERKKSSAEATAPLPDAPPSSGARAGGAAGGRKGGGGTAAAGSDSDDDWSAGGKGGGKGGGKKKAGGKGQAGKAAGKAAAPASKAAGGAAASSPSGLSVTKLVALLSGWHDDMLGAGHGGQKALVQAIAQVLLPGALATYERQLAVAFTAGAEARRRAREAVARAVDETVQRLLLLGRGVEHFAADEATYSTLQRHLARTTGAECVELMYRWVKAGQDTEDVPPATSSTSSDPTADLLRLPPLSASERSSIARAAPADVAAALTAAADGLSGATVKDVETLVESSMVAMGLPRPRKLDKRADKAAVAAHRQRLLEALESAAGQGPAAVLAVAVPLLATTATGKAVSLPGKAIGGVLATLKNQVEPEVFAAVSEYHALVVQQLKAQPTASSSGAQRQGAGATSTVEAELSSRTPRLLTILGSSSGGSAAGEGAASAGGGAAGEATTSVVTAAAEALAGPSTAIEAVTSTQPAGGGGGDTSASGAAAAAGAPAEGPAIAEAIMSASMVEANVADAAA